MLYFTVQWNLLLFQNVQLDRKSQLMFYFIIYQAATCNFTIAKNKNASNSIWFERIMHPFFKEKNSRSERIPLAGSCGLLL